MVPVWIRENVKFILRQDLAELLRWKDKYAGRELMLARHVVGQLALQQWRERIGVLTAVKGRGGECDPQKFDLRYSAAYPSLSKDSFSASCSHGFLGGAVNGWHC